MSDRTPCSVQYTRCTLQRATQITQRTAHAIRKATRTAHSLLSPHHAAALSCGFRFGALPPRAVLVCCIPHRSIDPRRDPCCAPVACIPLGCSSVCRTLCCARQGKARLLVPFLWPICAVACRVRCADRWLRPMVLCACFSDARCFTQVATWLHYVAMSQPVATCCNRAYHIATAQVLVSIQGLVLVEQPFYNEPGYEKQVLPVHAHPQRCETQRTSRSNRIVACCVLHVVFGACCMLRAACCVQQAACCVQHAACCMLHVCIRCMLHVILVHVARNLLRVAWRIWSVLFIAVILGE